MYSKVTNLGRSCPSSVPTNIDSGAEGFRPILATLTAKQGLPTEAGGIINNWSQMKGLPCSVGNVGYEHKVFMYFYTSGGSNMACDKTYTVNRLICQ